MGVNFFITPFSASTEAEALESGFKLDVSDFGDKLRQKWADVEITLRPEAEHIVMYWHCASEDFRLAGNIQGTDTVVLEKPQVHEVAEFALWYRSIIPTKYRLFLWNDADLEDMELLVDTTYLQLVRFQQEPDYAHVIARAADDFRINIDELIAKLRERWSDVKVYRGEAQDPYLSYWELWTEVRIEHEPPFPAWTGKILQSASIDRNQDGICLYYFPLSEIAEFALWYRSILPAGTELTLSCKSHNAFMELKTDTTEQEIIKTFRRPGFN